MPSYSRPGASSYDHQTTPRNNFYGALGGNQMYGDGYSVSPSTFSKSASFHHSKHRGLI